MGIAWWASSGGPHLVGPTAMVMERMHLPTHRRRTEKHAITRWHRLEGKDMRDRGDMRHAWVSALGRRFRCSKRDDQSLQPRRDYESAHQEMHA